MATTLNQSWGHLKTNRSGFFASEGLGFKLVPILWCMSAQNLLFTQTLGRKKVIGGNRALSQKSLGN